MERKRKISIAFQVQNKISLEETSSWQGTYTSPHCHEAGEQEKPNDCRRTRKRAENANGKGKYAVIDCLL